MDTVYTALVFPLLLLIGQTLVALGQRKISQHMDEGQAKTDAKRVAEAEWREHVVTRLDQQDERIDTILTAQCSQMRSDLIHRAHRYIDDLGCAGTEEKQSFWAEYEDYMRICDASNIVNHFIDNLAKQVMALPNREENR
jgi:hypothetical protein